MHILLKVRSHFRHNNYVIIVGKRSLDPLSVSYVPSIFIHNSLSEEEVRQRSERHERSLKRHKKPATETMEILLVDEEAVAEESHEVSRIENDVTFVHNEDEEENDEEQLTGEEIEIELGVLGDDENEDGNNGDINEFEYGTQDEEVNLPSVTHCEEMLEDCEYKILQLQLDREVLDIELEKQKQDKENISSMYDCCSKALRTLLSIKRELAFRLEKIEFRASSFKNDRKIRFYTGLPTFAVFSELVKLLSPFVEKPLHSKLDLMDELLITLAKLRRGFENQDLAYRVGIDIKYISITFHRWLDLMYRELKQLIMWPDRIALKYSLPRCFRGKYVNAVCIIDCFEIFIQTPSLLAAQTATYSHYKHHNTVKFLIGITPTGSISFVSQAWGGRASDKVITQRCGILKYFEYGDLVLADRGFNISDELAICGAHLSIPAFTKGRDQLSSCEIEKTRQLANVRIHVERVIGQLKNFKILQGVLPIKLIKKPDDTTVCTIDKIVTVAAAITNLSKPII